MTHHDREYDLLCETCGYSLGGLDEHGRCPECGRSIASSLPQSRAGTPWQTGPSLRAWLTTNWSMLRHPIESFDRVRIEPKTSRGLFVTNLAIAAALVVAPWTGILIGDPARGMRGSGVVLEALAMVFSFGFQAACVIAFVAFLTVIEFIGIRFIANRRGWRLTRAGAAQVCMNSSVGWVLSGICGMMVLAIMYSVQWFTGATPSGTLDLNPTLPLRISWYQFAGGGGVLLGYFAGLVLFEWLVYTGVRRCKYAATISPAAEPGMNAIVAP